MRARIIKPGFYANEQLAECSVLARLIFPGLWMIADRRGRLEDRPKRIKGTLLPYDDGDVDALLNELQRAGMLVRYTVGEQRLIQITAFERHQKCHPREVDSELHPVPDHTEGVESPCSDEQKQHLGTAEAQPRHNLGTAEATPRTPVLEAEAEAEAEAGEKQHHRARKRLSRSVAPPDPPDGVKPETWEAWRRQRGKKLTPEAVALQRRKLAELRSSGNDPNAVLEQSIANCWSGLFELKDRAPNNLSPPQQRLTIAGRQTAESLDRWMDESELRNGTTGP